jgi:hypothetical protein
VWLLASAGEHEVGLELAALVGAEDLGSAKVFRLVRPCHDSLAQHHIYAQAVEAFDD